MPKKHIITLAGDLASGKGTVAKLLQERLAYEIYCNGEYFRSLAAKKGMSVKDFNLYVESHPEIDQEIEKSAGQYAKEHDNLIIDARLGWYVVPEAFHVYMKVELEVAAKRALQDQKRKDTENYVSIEDAMQQIQARVNSENKRYRELYQVDRTDMNNYLFVIDTTNITPEETTEKILEAYQEWLQKE